MGMSVTTLACAAPDPELGPCGWTDLSVLQLWGLWAGQPRVWPCSGRAHGQLGVRAGRTRLSVCSGGFPARPSAPLQQGRFAGHGQGRFAGHGLGPDCPGTFLGLGLWGQGCARPMPGPCQGRVGAVPGLCQGRARTVPGLYQGYTGAVPGPCQGLCQDRARAMPVLCWCCARLMPGPCQARARAVPGLYQSSAKAVLGVCQGCTGAVPGPCQGSARAVPGLQLAPSVASGADQPPGQEHPLPCSRAANSH